MSSKSPPKVPAEESQDSEKSQDEVSQGSLERKSPPVNVDLNEIDAETQAKLKGDAIGDTLYSERFVLKTLMELKEHNGSKKIEETFEHNLCLLWDQTIEKGKHIDL